MNRFLIQTIVSGSLSSFEFCPADLKNISDSVVISLEKAGFTFEAVSGHPTDKHNMSEEIVKLLKGFLLGVITSITLSKGNIILTRDASMYITSIIDALNTSLISVSLDKKRVVVPTTQ